MSYSARINSVSTSPDGWTTVAYSILDGDATVTTHSQGFPPEMERLPEPRTRTVPQRADDGSGDVVHEGDPRRPVMIEEDYVEMVETGRWVTTSAETIHEAIRNFARDVLPLRVADAPVAQGDAVSLDAE